MDGVLVVVVVIVVVVVVQCNAEGKVNAAVLLFISYLRGRWR